MANVGIIGSASNHGGHITTGSSDTFANGIGIARAGDAHNCPIPGHGVTTMHSTSAVKVNGASIVRVGIDQAGCGALITHGSLNVNAS